MDNSEDKDTFNKAIHYFQNVTYDNIKIGSKYKMGATCIGIKTNISGKSKLHVYFLLFPFMHEQPFQPYNKESPNIYLQDISFLVDPSFYQWLYSEMSKRKSIIMLNLDLEDSSLKVVYSDILVKISDREREREEEKDEWYNMGFEKWYERGEFNTSYSVEIINPYLYLVPFPVKPLYFITHTNSNILLHTYKKN